MLILINNLILDIVFDLIHAEVFHGSGFVKKVVIFGPDMRSSVHISNERKDIFIVVKGPIDSLDDTKLTAEKEYFINFTEE